MTNDVGDTIRKQYHALSRSKKDVAQFILDNIEEVAFMTASRLARTVGVSESLIVRLAKDLGYDGYPDMQHSCRAVVRTRISKAEKLEKGTTAEDSEGVLSTVLSRDIENIRFALRRNTEAMLQEAADMIISARKVRIVGFRSSTAPAVVLSVNLKAILDDVQLLSPTYGDLHDDLRRVGSQDLVITITFARYTKSTVLSAEYAKSRGAKVLAITDSLASPLAKWADLVLQAEGEGVSYAVSQTAAVSLANALVHFVSLRAPNAASRLKEADESDLRAEVYYLPADSKRG